jgi:hypothetical protein
MDPQQARHRDTTKKKLNDIKHSIKLMWGCMILAVVAIVLVFSGVGAGAFFITPCPLMMGAMMWMMMGGARGNSTGGRSTR